MPTVEVVGQPFELTEQELAGSITIDEMLTNLSDTDIIPLPLSLQDFTAYLTVIRQLLASNLLPASVKPAKLTNNTLIFHNPVIVEARRAVRVIDYLNNVDQLRSLLQSLHATYGLSLASIHFLLDNTAFDMFDLVNGQLFEPPGLSLIRTYVGGSHSLSDSLFNSIFTNGCLSNSCIRFILDTLWTDWSLHEYTPYQAFCYMIKGCDLLSQTMKAELNRRIVRRPVDRSRLDVEVTSDFFSLNSYEHSFMEDFFNPKVVSARMAKHYGLSDYRPHKFYKILHRRGEVIVTHPVSTCLHYRDDQYIMSSTTDGALPALTESQLKILTDDGYDRFEGADTGLTYTVTNHNCSRVYNIFSYNRLHPSSYYSRDYLLFLYEADPLARKIYAFCL